MKVHEIWRYPVKSMLGSTVDTAALDALGIVGDRRWAVRDAETGGIRGGKKLGALMRCAATFTDASGTRAEITLPDGTVTLTDAADASALISAAVGTPVLIDFLHDASEWERFRRRPSGSPDPMADLRAEQGREGDEPLPDFSVFPRVLFEYESPPGAYYDALPLMIMTSSSLRSLHEALPDSVIDVRRFRPSLVIDTGDTVGHPEFGWAKGTRFALGSAIIEIDVACPRCVMPTREISDAIPQDRAILRHIIRELDQNLGVYAWVVQAGTVNVGDIVTAA